MIGLKKTISLRIIKIFVPCCQWLTLAMTLFLFGCTRPCVTVTREVVDKQTLASTFVKSPDPRQCDPPEGEVLSISWFLPSGALDEPLELVVSLVYRNAKEEVRCFPINSRLGMKSLSFLGEEYRGECALLAYRAEVINQQGRVMTKWQHQLWTKLIVIKDETPW